eukprot:6178045-Pleurochrysis_carterae.AAC.1
MVVAKEDKSSKMSVVCRWASSCLVPALPCGCGRLQCVCPMTNLSMRREAKPSQPGSCARNKSLNQAQVGAVATQDGVLGCVKQEYCAVLVERGPSQTIGNTAVPQIVCAVRSSSLGLVRVRLGRRQVRASKECELIQDWKKSRRIWGKEVERSCKDASKRASRLQKRLEPNKLLHRSSIKNISSRARQGGLHSANHARNTLLCGSCQVRRKRARTRRT